MLETVVKHTNNEIRIVVDPHDGACHGAHNIIVWAQRVGWQDVHVTYGWQGTAFLSEQGTSQFVDALQYAVRRGQELAETLRAGPLP